MAMKKNSNARRAARKEHAFKAALYTVQTTLETTRGKLAKVERAHSIASSELRHAKNTQIALPKDFYEQFMSGCARDLGRGMADTILAKQKTGDVGRFVDKAAHMLADEIMGYISLRSRDSLAIKGYARELVENGDLRFDFHVEGNLSREMDRMQYLSFMPMGVRRSETVVVTGNYC